MMFITEFQWLVKDMAQLCLLNVVALFSTQCVFTKLLRAAESCYLLSLSEIWLMSEP